MVVRAESQAHRMSELERALETTEHSSLMVILAQIPNIYRALPLCQVAFQVLCTDEPIKASH